MTHHWISDDDAAALLQGRTPAGRPELASLASGFAQFRVSASRVPQPSAQLASNLAATTVPTALAPSNRKRARHVITWFASLGVAAKLLLASTVAAAAVVGTGAAGVLPEPAQDTYNAVVSVVTEEEQEPTEEPTEEPTVEPTEEPTGDPEEGTHPDNFGGMVSELAQNKPGSGYEFGKFVSAAAHEKKDSDDSEPTPTDDATGDSDESVKPGNSGNHTEGNGNGGGKPEGTPGGGKPDKAKKH